MLISNDQVINLSVCQRKAILNVSMVGGGPLKLVGNEVLESILELHCPKAVSQHSKRNGTSGGVLGKVYTR